MAVLALYRDQEGIRVSLTMTHKQIGQVIEASHEMVKRALGEFRPGQIVADKQRHDERRTNEN
jgi:Crp-like helix-turn-helix domain